MISADGQNNNENIIIVETNPVNNVHVEIPSAVVAPGNLKLIQRYLYLTLLFYGMA